MDIAYDVLTAIVIVIAIVTVIGVVTVIVVVLAVMLSQNEKFRRTNST